MLQILNIYLFSVLLKQDPILTLTLATQSYVKIPNKQKFSGHYLIPNPIWITRHSEKMCLQKDTQDFIWKMTVTSLLKFANLS